MRYETTSLRRDTQQVARSTGAAAGAWFWGIIGTVAAIGLIGHLITKVPVGEWIAIGAGVMVAGLIMAFVMAEGDSSPQPPPPVRAVPPLVQPDLRQSDVFEGKW